MTLTQLSPDQYEGEDLCPRCGVGAETGAYYAICVDGYACSESCAKYRYQDLCAPCEIAETEIAGEMTVGLG